MKHTFRFLLEEVAWFDSRSKSGSLTSTLEAGSRAETNFRRFESTETTFPHTAGAAELAWQELVGGLGWHALCGVGFDMSHYVEPCLIFMTSAAPDMSQHYALRFAVHVKCRNVPSTCSWCVLLTCSIFLHGQCHLTSCEWSVGVLFCVSQA